MDSDIKTFLAIILPLVLFVCVAMGLFTGQWGLMLLAVISASALIAITFGWIYFVTEVWKP